MLELRPTCEHCNTPLPPEAVDARICTYECTFCAACVDRILGNVCPNCGGGFVPRPIRPSRNWKGDNYLGKDPAQRHQVIAGQVFAKLRAPLLRVLFHRAEGSRWRLEAVQAIGLADVPAQDRAFLVEAVKGSVAVR